MTHSSDPPRHRAIVAVDIEDSTTRTNSSKARIREVMYDLLEKVLQAAGITEHHRDPLIDRGDGVLALIHPVDQVSKILLLNPVVPALSDLLADHDATFPDDRFRLRVVVHAGEVHYDGRGCFGEALDIAFRLLDAPRVKMRLRESTAPLILVVSDDIYRSVVRHGYDGIDGRDFEPLVHIQIAGRDHAGWIQLPSESGCHPAVRA